MPNQNYETRVRPRLDEITMLARQGMPECTIAKRLNISQTSLRRYKKEFNELAEALSSRERANLEVLNAFFKRACGYVAEEEVKELKEIKEEDGSARKELITTKIVRKDVAPDLAAVKWWMENRGLIFPLQEQSKSGGDLAEAKALLVEKERILRLLAEGEAEGEQAEAETVGD